MERIRDNPEKYIKIDEMTGCWNWQKDINSHGYGRFVIDNIGNHVYTHVYFWEKKFGSIEEKYPFNVLDHKCNNRACCNPDHLQRSCIGKNWSRHFAEKTHCPKGHLYEGDNLIVTNNYGRIQRACKECKKAYLRKYYKRRKKAGTWNS